VDREIRIHFKKYDRAKYSAVKRFLKLLLPGFSCIYGKCSENVVKVLSTKLAFKGHSKKLLLELLNL